MLKIRKSSGLDFHLGKISQAQNASKTGVCEGFLTNHENSQKRGCGYLEQTLEPPLPETQTSRHGALDGTDGAERRRKFT